MRHYQGWYISDNIWSSISETKKQKKTDAHSTIYIDSPDLLSIASVKCNLSLIKGSMENPTRVFKLPMIHCLQNEYWSSRTSKISTSAHEIKFRFEPTPVPEEK